MNSTSVRGCQDIAARYIDTCLLFAGDFVCLKCPLGIVQKYQNGEFVICVILVGTFCDVIVDIMSIGRTLGSQSTVVGRK